MPYRLKIPIVLCGASKVACHGLARMLELGPEIEVVCREKLAPGKPLERGTVVVVCDLPDEATQQYLFEQHRLKMQLRLVFLVAPDQIQDIPASLRSEAHGILDTGTSPQGLVEAIRSAHQGRYHCDVADPRSLDWQVPVAKAPPAMMERLSKRERQVLVHLAMGRTSKEISHLTGLCARTIDTYRFRILRKLRVKSRSQLVTIALLSGLLNKAAASAS